MMTPKNIRFVSEHLNDDLLKLSLKQNVLADVDLKFALAQIKARQSIRKKLPEWYENMQLEMPVQLSTEQSSSQKTARFKTSLFSKKGGLLVDLTGGMGVDCFYLSQQFEKTVYVERDAELCRIALHNFSVFGRNDISVKNAQAEDFLAKMPSADCIFLDPSRRGTKGKKVYFLEDCTPDVTKLLDLLFEKSSQILIKLSPMLDLKHALSQLKCAKEVLAVSVENECKELLFLLEKSNQKPTQITAVNFQKNDVQRFSFSQEEEGNAPFRFAESLQEYLYEPNASMMKIGAYKMPTAHFPLQKLHANTHLYTSDEFVSDFPGRIFRIVQTFGFSKNELRECLKNVSSANLTVRNFPETVEVLRKKLKLKEGGDVYLFATTFGKENKKILLRCEKV